MWPDICNGRRPSSGLPPELHVGVGRFEDAVPRCRSLSLLQAENAGIRLSVLVLQIIGKHVTLERCCTSIPIFYPLTL